MVCILAALCLGASPALASDLPLLLAQESAAGEPAPDVSRMTVSELGQLWRENEVLILAILSGVVLLLLWAAKVITPGGLAKGGLRDVKPFPAPVWFFAAMVTYLALYSAVAIAQMPAVESVVHGPAGPPADGQLTVRALALTQGLGYLVAIIAGVGMLYLLSKTATDAGLGIGGLDLPVGAGCFVLAYPLVALAGVASVFLYEYFQGQLPEPIAHSTLGTIVGSDGDPYQWVLIAVVVFAAPVFEELVYRGCVQSAMLKLTGSPWGAIVLTSVAFTAVHRISPVPVPWHALLMIFVLSLALGAAYERTKKLGVPIVMHMCFNGLNVALALALTNDATA